ncbi:MAG: 16S rRNA (cytosine(967)-C(5))-methyltransferase RsmB [Chthoniobacterales bacterium]
MPTSRFLALDALRRWRAGTKFADQIVADLFRASGLSAPDRAFALELFYGALRNLTLLDFWIAQLRPNPVDDNSRDLLRLGLYQILLLETAAHAAVFETVELAPKRARGLINALLRRALRERESLTSRAAAEPLAVRCSEPAFLVAKWTRQFGEEAAAKLCRWNNQPAPVYTRVNPVRLTADEFLAKYPEAKPLADHPQFVTLPDPARALANGDCYIQDPSTVLAGELLEPLPGESVLDACAAPGGKAAHLAGLLQKTGTLVVADRDEPRLDRLRDNLVRLGAGKITIVRCDWLDPDSIRAASFQPESFHKILVDAPCSNTGVMRRRVDVRWRLRPEDFPKMQAQQLTILRHVAPLLKPGGSLVYSTCSLEPEENEEVVAAFLRERPAFRLTKSANKLPLRDHFEGA